MRILSPPRRTTISGATFSRESQAYDSLGRIAERQLPRLEYVDGVGWVTWVEEGTENLIIANPNEWHVGGSSGHAGVKTNLGIETGIVGDIVRFTNSGTAESFLRSINYKNTLSPSMLYTLSFKYRGTVGTEKFEAFVISDIGTLVQTYSGYIQCSSNWQKYTKTFTTTSNITGTNQYVRFDHNGNDSGYIDIAEVSLIQKTYPLSFPGYAGTRAAESLTMPVLGTNLLTVNQASVETDTSGFVGRGIVRDSTRTYHGSYSLKTTTPGAVSGEGYHTGGSRTAILPSQTYTLSGYFCGTGNLRMVLTFMDSSGSGVGNSGVDFVVSDNWTRYYVTYTSPGTASLAQINVMTRGAQAVTFYTDCLQLEPGPYATTFNLPTGATPRMGLPAEHGTIEGIIEITDIFRRSNVGTSSRLFTLQRLGGNDGIMFYHYNSGSGYGLYTYNDSGVNTSNSIVDGLLPNGWYYYKCYWSSSIAIIEFWNLLTKTKAASTIISTPNLPSAFGSLYIGSISGTTYFANTRFGKHRLSNIARTDDPDFDNLMSNDANTVGIFDPTPVYNHLI